MLILKLWGKKYTGLVEYEKMVSLKVIFCLFIFKDRQGVLGEFD